MKCPICHKPVEETTVTKPFCSERCKLIDLGNWLGGKYVIPGERTSQGQPDDDED